MIAVIQCAARKRPDAGHLLRRDGKKVLFVADPELAPVSVDYAYARPDDISDIGISWREILLKYNDNPDSNPLGLLPAWQLYENKTYKLLKDWNGLDRLYILSAGWGLISADFLTPAYDITFSARADKYKLRRSGKRYDDLRMLSTHTTEPIVFFGGKDYVSLFSSLTEGVMGQRYVFYNSKNLPDAPGCTLKRFNTTARMNWHYECARAFINGEVGI